VNVVGEAQPYQHPVLIIGLLLTQMYRFNSCFH
jgi:hypothetical protein